MVAGLLAFFSMPSEAGLIVFSDRSSFDAAAPGLPIEDFEEASIGAMEVAGIPAPLDSTSNNGYFLPGDILPGIQFHTNTTHNNDELALLGPGYAGSPSKLIVANYFTDAFYVVLSPGVHAIGFDVHSFMGGGMAGIEVYDPDGFVLGTYDWAAGPAGTFWGAISDSEPIGSVRIFDAGGGAEGVDNVAFGEAAIPEPATLGLSGMALLALAFLRRRLRN